eukprot:scaffold5664_cov115-Isochrysis_galbana.AAC.16
MMGLAHHRLVTATLPPPPHTLVSYTITVLFCTICVMATASSQLIHMPEATVMDSDRHSWSPTDRRCSLFVAPCASPHIVCTIAPQHWRAVRALRCGDAGRTRTGRPAGWQLARAKRACLRVASEGLASAGVTAMIMTGLPAGQPPGCPSLRPLGLRPPLPVHLAQSPTGSYRCRWLNLIHAAACACACLRACSTWHARPRRARCSGRRRRGGSVCSVGAFCPCELTGGRRAPLLAAHPAARACACSTHALPRIQSASLCLQLAWRECQKTCT